MGTEITYPSGEGVGERYYSIAPTDFQANFPKNEYIDHAGGEVAVLENSVRLVAPVHLPHGAIVTGLIVYGVVTGAESWTLYYTDIDDSNSSAMATGAINGADITIDDAIIDNWNRAYYIETSTFDAYDRIQGGLIVYNI